MRLHRDLIAHPAFRNDAEAMAFAWLFARAAWKGCRVRYKGHAITLQRGQVAISVRDMADALDRDKAWVERLFKRLKSETMIETRVETGVSVVTICNYDKYQPRGDTDKTDGETPVETDARQTRDTEQRTEEVKEEDRSEAKASSPDLRPEHVVEAWNALAERNGLARVAKLSPARRRALNCRIRQHTIQDFTEAIGAIERSPFLLGDNKRAWRADFDFFLQPSSFLKLIEGSYDRAPT